MSAPQRKHNAQPYRDDDRVVAMCTACGWRSLDTEGLFAAGIASGFHNAWGGPMTDATAALPTLPPKE